MSDSAPFISVWSLGACKTRPAVPCTTHATVQMAQRCCCTEVLQLPQINDESPENFVKSDCNRVNLENARRSKVTVTLECHWAAIAPH
ncbi:hypothetical protein E2C01_017523 [Portunus trituberculatus]|uniref:Uncharacterized protein n=1 Tax=Portunus trituberculatus TaxID=210409 RepID=A0A5B7DRY9_PORTR|nr:hypothetical protein [Portunus trituberculatus]